MSRMITVRLSDEALAGVERARMDVPRERWIRELLAAAVAAQDSLHGAGGRLVIYGEGESGPVEVDAVGVAPERRRVGRILGMPRVLPPDPNGPVQITLEEVLADG